MKPITVRHWRARQPEVDPILVQTLSAALGIESLLAEVLVRRGWSEPAAARSFLYGRLGELPDPLLLQGMAAAVARLQQALLHGERIAIHGDYDVDGISATALLVENLRAFGATVEYHIPLRLRDGYGLSAEALRLAAANGASVAISVDCGISAIEEARLARELGLDLIVTDHHLPPAQLPEALVLIDPQLPGCAYPDKQLAGVGVAFMLLVALRQQLRQTGYFQTRSEPDLRHSLDLVALGTIADVATLTGVNRLLVRTGLEVLNRGRRPGLAALMTVAGVTSASCGVVGFSLAPRLNAAGRLEDAGRGVELLLESDPLRCRELADALDRCNRERQQLELHTLEEALAQLHAVADDRHSIVLAAEGWHPGVIGIVASRLVERFHRPTVLIAVENGNGKGSGRSISGLHLHAVLSRCAEHLSGFGGHAAAAGLSLADAAIAPFAAAFEAEVCAVLEDEELLPTTVHDGEVLLEQLSLPAVAGLQQLAPFGVGNPEPVFCLCGVRVQQLTAMGEQHLRFTARQGGYSLPVVAFGMAARRDELQGEVDLLVSPQLNEWRGTTSVQLRLREVRPVR